MSKGDDKTLFISDNHCFCSESQNVYTNNDSNNKNQCHEPLSFQSIDPFNLNEWCQSIENVLTEQQQKCIRNPFLDDENDFFSLQNPLLSNNEMQINSKSSNSSACDILKCSEQIDYPFDRMNSLVINDELDVINSNLLFSQKANEESFNYLNTNIEASQYDNQHSEDEVNSSPQICQKSAYKKSNRKPYDLFSAYLLNRFSQNKNAKIKRKNFTEEQRQIMINFIKEHKENPYIDNKSVEKISKETGLSAKQIRIFFTNYRIRNDCSQKRRSRKPICEKI